MKKFNVTVTLTKEYEVEVDETIYDLSQQEAFEQTFWDLPNGDTPAESFAIALAEQSARLGVNTFIEGFGQCVRDEESYELYAKMGKHYTKGLYIQEVDEDIEAESEEIKDKED